MLWQARRGLITGRGALDAAPAGGGSPFTLIASTSKTGGTTPQATPAIDTTGANLLIMACAFYQATNSVSDSKGNTWTGLTARIPSDSSVRLYYCVPTSVGSGHTFTMATGAGIAFGVQAWSGANATPFDVENGTSAGSSSPMQPGSVTPSANNSLIVCVGTSNVGTSYGIDSGFTATFNQNAVGGTNEGNIFSYLLQSTAAAVNPSISWTGTAATRAAAIAVFKS